MINKLIETYIAPYKALIAAGLAVVFIVIVFFVYLFWQSDSKQEIKADETRSNVEIQQANTSVSNAQVERVAPQVETAEKTSQRAVNRAKQARETKVSNANVNAVIGKCEELYGKGECR
jgi:uncharacterized protein (DUF58 family)